MEAVDLPHEDFRERFGFAKSKLFDKRLVTYCAGGVRSELAAKILQYYGNTQ
jgi:rhodanese-related sulfurtransferase